LITSIFAARRELGLTQFAAQIGDLYLKLGPQLADLGLKLGAQLGEVRLGGDARLLSPLLHRRDNGFGLRLAKADLAQPLCDLQGGVDRHVEQPYTGFIAAASSS
jgi:hypothetical protein